MSQFGEIKIGDLFVRKLTITNDIMDAFKNISGDNHPLHTQREYACAKGFRERIAYGNLMGFMISSLVGVEMLRFEVMLISQSITYRKPVFVGETITLCGTIDSKFDAMEVVELKINIKKQDEQLVASGKVQVKCL